MREPDALSGPAPPASDADRLEDWVVLGSVLPVIPPDETPGIEGVRDMQDDEVAQFDRDVLLLTTLAPATPYSRAATAFEAVQAVAHDVGGSEQLTRRGQQRVLRALAVFARAMEALPVELTSSLHEHLGEGPHTERLAAARAELESHPAYRLAIALDAAPADTIVVVSNGDVVELAVPRKSLGRWRAAAGIASLADIGLLRIAADALGFSQRMTSRWVLEHADVINDASHRIARLGGEITCGRPTVLKMQLRLREGADPQPTNATLAVVPLAEMHAVQAMLHRAARVLNEDDRRPALRGGRGVRVEQVVAALGDDGMLEQSRDLDRAASGWHDERSLIAGEDGTGGIGGRRAQGPAAVGPTDMVSLVAYMDVGRRRLEEAWWRAFADEDLAALVGDWLSLIKGAAAAWMPVGEPQGSGRLQTPLSIDTAAGLSLEFDSPAAAAQARAAQQATIATIESMVSAIRERSEPASTGMGPWLSSGAFASLRDQLEMLGYLSGVGAESPDPAAVSLSRALRAAQRADPEAVLIHLARAVHAADAGAVEAADPVTASLLTRTVEAARRLAAGEHLDHSAVALLAGTALPATASLLSEPPGASA